LDDFTDQGLRGKELSVNQHLNSGEIYQRKVEEVAHKNQGRILFFDKFKLSRLQSELRVTPSEARNIEREVLATFHPPHFRQILFTSLVITIAMMGLRYFGLLQWLELPVYDVMIRVRPAEEIDKYVSILEITDSFLKKDEQISDASLLILLKKLEKLQPSVIGIDIYRDPTRPGLNKTDYKNLVGYLQNSKSIVATCSANYRYNNPNVDGVIPPKTEENLVLTEENLGFNDAISDIRDGKIRRQLLTIYYPSDDKKPPCGTGYSLSFELANRYLSAKNVKLLINDEGISGRGVFFKELARYPVMRPFGYSPREEIEQFQMMLNYRSPGLQVEAKLGTQAVFNNISIDQVLEMDKNVEDQIKNRIVLIGYTSRNPQRNQKDLRSTPYSLSGDADEPGVVIQAHMVSQLVNAVLEKRTLLGVWSLPIEVFWVGSWALLGGSLSWLNKSQYFLVINASFFVVIIIITSSILFYYGGWWVPLVPPIICLIFTAGIGNKMLYSKSLDSE
jgi:CHASE2 domain-containing sensor protein